MRPLVEVTEAARGFIEAWHQAAAPPSANPLAPVTAARRLSATVDEAMSVAVAHARAAGQTWQEIGDVLGTSRQAAFQRFGRSTDPRRALPGARNLVPRAADRAVTLLLDLMAGRLADVRRDFDDGIAMAVDEERLVLACDQVTALVGAHEGLGEPVARGLGLATIVDVPMRFEGGDLVGRVTFRPDGRVAGLVMYPPELS